MKISYVLTAKGPNCFSVAPDAPLLEAVRLMCESRIGSLCVQREGKLVSIVTERDVLWAVNNQGADMGHLKVKDVMAPYLITCHANTNVDEAMSLMMNNSTGHRIRHLPVVDDAESLLGVISMSDIVTALLTETRFENKLLKNYIRNWPESEE